MWHISISRVLVREKELFERKPLRKNLDEVQTRRRRRQPLDAKTKTGAQVALHYITLAARLAPLLPIIKTMCHALTQLVEKKQMDSHAAVVSCLAWAPPLGTDRPVAQNQQCALHEFNTLNTLSRDSLHKHIVLSLISGAKARHFDPALLANNSFCGLPIKLRGKSKNPYSAEFFREIQYSRVRSKFC